MGCECSPLSREYPRSELVKVDYKALVEEQMEEYPVLIYSSAQCPEAEFIKGELRKLEVDFESFEVEYMRNRHAAESKEMKNAVRIATAHMQLPVLILKGEVVGGMREVNKALASGELVARLKKKNIECKDIG